LQVELLRRGASHVTNLEISQNYEAEAARLLDEAEMTDQVTRRFLDIAQAPDEVEPADVVILHRVVCCYPDYGALLTAAADHARAKAPDLHPRATQRKHPRPVRHANLPPLLHSKFLPAFHPPAAGHGPRRGVRGHDCRIPAARPGLGRCWSSAVTRGSNRSHRIDHPPVCAPRAHTVYAALGVVQAWSSGLGGEARYRDHMASTGKIEAFLAEPRNIVVAGIRRDGTPHLSPKLVLLGRPPVLRIDHAAPASLHAPPCCCATSAIRQPRSWPPTSGARRAGSQRGIPARMWSWWPGSPPWLGAHFYLCSWCAELDLRHTEHPG